MGWELPGWCGLLAAAVIGVRAALGMVVRVLVERERRAGLESALRRLRPGDSLVERYGDGHIRVIRTGVGVGEPS